VFHDLVKCTYGSTAPVRVYNITFQAQTVEVPFNITTFLATVTESYHDQDEPPQVVDCVIQL